MNMSGELDFSIALMEELVKDSINWYGVDNWDSYRFGPYHQSIKEQVITILNRLGSHRIAVVRKNLDSEISSLLSKQDFILELSSLYELLADEASRSTLVKVIAYRILGYRKVKLPLNTRSYWLQQEYVRSFIKSRNNIRIKFQNWVLRHYSLDKIGYPIEIYFVPGGIVATFILKQYEYGKGTTEIKAQEGDYVIDAGGCWGDTALYFAHTVGKYGKVYTFEFSPDNLEVLYSNLRLNPETSERIEVHPIALWDRSGEQVIYSANGPGTSLTSTLQGSLETPTISIDEFVRDAKLPRVDYIKMDVEGSELRILRGAEWTLRNFKPRLVISLYHREEDFISIPQYLDGLGLGYEFFLDHFSIHQEETILFATS